MSDPDVVKEITDDLITLARFQLEPAVIAERFAQLMTRARDEIVALRVQQSQEEAAFISDIGRISISIKRAIDEAMFVATPRIRAEVLEQAARIAECGGGAVGASIAKSIRALKDKP
jgi:hypothetical protein